METPILGLHHVTATVAEAQPDLDFFAGVVGLRLVKKTVNFDNRGVYHFYYGDERGAPGTLMTTFPYAGKGVREGTKGAGQITATSFSVPPGSLSAWADRLDGLGVPHGEGATRFGERALRVADPSGLVLELVEGIGDAREPWTGAGIEAGTAVRGLHAVTLTVRDARPTVEFLEGPLGYRIVGREGRLTRLAAGGARPGRFIEVLEAPDAPPAVNGIGTVHHVAMAVATSEVQLAIRADLIRLGRSVTEVRDRQYFLSIYFREPGGVLYEVATLGPGFTVDEDVTELGTGLRLPPWEEPSRSTIETALPHVEVPG